MDKNYILLPVAAVIVFILAIVVTNQMFVITEEYTTGDDYIQLDASNERKEFEIGEKIFRHEMYVTTDPPTAKDGESNLYLDYIQFSYDGIKFTGKVGDTISINDYMSVKINDFDYIRIDSNTKAWKVSYLVYIDPDKFLTFNVVDTQQKLLNNDIGNINICSSFDNTFSGSITVVQNYENSQYDKMYDYNLEYPVGCKDFKVTLNPTALGEFDAKFFSSIIFKEYIGMLVMEVDSNSAAEVQNYFVKYKTSTKHIYSRKQLLYPYICVNEIKYRQSINCKAQACPEGFNCIETLYNNITYDVCMKSTISITNPLRDEPIIEDCTSDECFVKEDNFVTKIWNWMKELWLKIVG